MRLNSFNLIHKALRALLYDTASTLQQTYFVDAEEAEIALSKIETVIEQFEEHAYHEDNIILPSVQAFDPALVDDFESQHEEDHELGEKLKNLINVFRSIEDDEEKIHCGSAINKSFRDFLVFNLEHMSKEEIEINRVLWKHYTDEDIMELSKKIAANLTPEQKAFTAKWMMRGLNKAEIIMWLQTIRPTVPSFVFQSLLQMTETELPKNMRAEVQEVFVEQEMAV